MNDNRDFKQAHCKEKALILSKPLRRGIGDKGYYDDYDVDEDIHDEFLRDELKADSIIIPPPQE
jgi:hypothetical protein